MSAVVEGNGLPVPAEPTSGPLAILPTRGHGKLAEALSLARARCKAAAKDRENTFHKYTYASAEAILNEAKDALDGSGLALVPLTQELRIQGSGNATFYELRRCLALVHASGESLPVRIDWPVVPDRGRPLDKAMAAAITTSLAYYLRDLLMMPRVDPDDDIAARDDRDHDPCPAPPPPEKPRPLQPPPAKPAKATPPPQAPASEPTTMKEFGVLLRAKQQALQAAGLIRPNEAWDYVRSAAAEAQFPADFNDWKAVHVKTAVGWLQALEQDVRKPKPAESTTPEPDAIEEELIDPIYDDE